MSHLDPAKFEVIGADAMARLAREVALDSG